MKQPKSIFPRARRFIFLFFLCLSILIGFSGVTDSLSARPIFEKTRTRTIEKTFEVRHGGLLTLATNLGQVSVEGWDQGEVRVHIVVEGIPRYVNDAEFHIAATEQDVSIRAEIPRVHPFFGNWANRIRVIYRIKVPHQYNLQVKTARGRLTLKDVEGQINARTSGGRIDAEKLTGSIHLATSGGNIAADQVHGDVFLRTSGGSVTVHGSRGMLEVRTSGGRIRLTEIEAQVVAHTSGGGIVLEFTGVNKGIDLRTSGGSINVTLPADIQGNLTARTSGGTVSSDFPLAFQGALSRSSLEGTINGGGPDILLRTSGGGIRVNKHKTVEVK